MNEKSQKIVDEVQMHLDNARASIEAALDAMRGADPRANGLDFATFDGYNAGYQLLAEFKTEIGEL